MTVLDLDRFARDSGATTPDELSHKLRLAFAHADSICTLAGTTLVSADPAVLERCDREMAWYFDDLGNCFFDCWDGVKHAIQNGDLLSTAPTTGDLRGKFAGLPCIALGAGPGANDHWAGIKASRGHAVLIACDVMLEPCLARGIVPDFVTSMERTPATYECLTGMPKDGVTFLATPVVEKRAVDEFQGRVIWCWRPGGCENWVDATIKVNNFGRSCGTQAVGVALLAGCSPVYLVGHDLCMQGAATHAVDAQATTKGTAEKIEQEADEYHQRIPERSISGRVVDTMQLWQMFRQDLQYLIHEHPGQTVINTGDGLPIIGTIPGELPPTWGQLITIPTITRAKVGNNRRRLIPLMQADIPVIEARCRAVMAKDEPIPEDMQLSLMVGEDTKQVWLELFGGTYSGSLVRLNLQPTRQMEISMLKRVANTIIHTLPIIRYGLHAL